jgi:hypothetical protein
MTEDFPENPYQDVIDWLRSREGESWSETRIACARRSNGNYGHTLVQYGAHSGEIWMGGVLSVKDDT